ncbi:hypothetical protein HETIRDRAFT_453022 [Heterobasidion irregulare TC 32-1]|uniref:Uncharacterized protein n=1 Tax=Heterobasidion irregulare (strain TC 32-1) TaxID=747525 RepID=W4K2I0_HETIT|nr:uncharacterized protein HETIRDRAFT_453022 [Heterobasidion irregulare TC 32-1]ETW80017.1 hypothetical protein HETIRDRAFT_453022 [Heterobasidion irregulare TC 32-1]
MSSQHGEEDEGPLKSYDRHTEFMLLTMLVTLVTTINSGPPAWKPPRTITEKPRSKPAALNAVPAVLLRRSDVVAAVVDYASVGFSDRMMKVYVTEERPVTLSTSLAFANLEQGVKCPEGDDSRHVLLPTAKISVDGWQGLKAPAHFPIGEHIAILNEYLMAINQPAQDTDIDKRHLTCYITATSWFKMKSRINLSWSKAFIRSLKTMSLDRIRGFIVFLNERGLYHISLLAKRDPTLSGNSDLLQLVQVGQAVYKDRALPLYTEESCVGFHQCLVSTLVCYQAALQEMEQCWRAYHLADKILMHLQATRTELATRESPDSKDTMVKLSGSPFLVPDFDSVLSLRDDESLAQEYKDKIEGRTLEAVERLEAFSHGRALYAMGPAQILEHRFYVLSSSLLHVLDTSNLTRRQQTPNMDEDLEAELQAEAELWAAVEIRDARVCNNVELSQFAKAFKGPMRIQLLASSRIGGPSSTGSMERGLKTFAVEERLKRDTDAQIQGRSQIAPILEAFRTAFDEEPKLKLTGTVRCEAALAAAMVNVEAADVNGEWQPLAKTFDAFLASVSRPCCPVCWDVMAFLRTYAAETQALSLGIEPVRSSGSPVAILATPIDIADRPSEADSASFEMRGRHSSVWPAALPPWTPEVALDEMVESLRTRLRERIDDVRWDTGEREMARLCGDVCRTVDRGQNCVRARIIIRRTGEATRRTPPPFGFGFGFARMSDVRYLTRVPLNMIREAASDVDRSGSAVSRRLVDKRERLFLCAGDSRAMKAYI